MLNAHLVHLLQHLRPHLHLLLREAPQGQRNVVQGKVPRTLQAIGLELLQKPVRDLVPELAAAPEQRGHVLLRECVHFLRHRLEERLHDRLVRAVAHLGEAPHDVGDILGRGLADLRAKLFLEREHKVLSRVAFELYERPQDVREALAGELADDLLRGKVDLDQGEEFPVGPVAHARHGDHDVGHVLGVALPQVHAEVVCHLLEEIHRHIQP
mmetsp:Transcript_849/g.2166  ORF Transcript_849/g.2166 Transcript_849/m.2166 type:complete len:212 (-) Transcript_849:348-983(-)